ncbi:uncharacterized protein N7483_009175 [Penicillium malachiteum]|uniref:uncharacterized protein n=1 Tax=Penicillium malachiteum TaxID=1324776 RepID=UPI002549179E|nr:uncharacterized protein N7483_009175 [Penicillium malachiteum]KAJ5721241.1 hypothetical protein N7483_009175 [Penicillium malachiteum]
MEANTGNLRLEIPRKHEIFFNELGDTHSSPISGSALLMIQSNKNSHAEFVDLEYLKISLIRDVTASDQNCATSGEHLLGRINRWFTTNPKITSHDTTTRNCSIIEEVTLHVPHLYLEPQVGYSLQEGRTYKIPFHIPIPADLPSTLTTSLGDITYFVVASARTTRGENLSASEEITLLQHLIPEQDLVQRTRTYRNSNFVTKIILTQNIAAITNSKLPATAEVFVRPPATPAGRSTEYKCVAIRGIQWRIEEVIKLVYEPECESESRSECSQIEDKICVREICKGFQKGYWKTLPAAKSTDQSADCEDSSVEIALEIEFPESQVFIPEVDISCYEASFSRTDSSESSASFQPSHLSTTQQRIILTTEHRLRLDISTTEDTFDTCDHSLVDRKPLRIANNASFPLQIVDKAEGNMAELLSQGSPPRYEEVPISPPKYHDE